MTATHADVLTTTPEQAAAELLRLAEFVAAHDEDFPSWILRSGLRLFVSASIPDDVVSSRFEALVEAVKERGRWVADPDEFAVRRDLVPSMALDYCDNETAREVDAAVWDLLSPTQACVRCQKFRPRKHWRPALMPASLYCSEHRPAQT